MKGSRNLSIQPAKGSTRAIRHIGGAKVKETSCLRDLFVFFFLKNQCFYSSQKKCSILNRLSERGTICT